MSKFEISLRYNPIHLIKNQLKTFIPSFKYSTKYLHLIPKSGLMLWLNTGLRGTPRLAYE
jgi:hypothetical protein